MSTEKNVFSFGSLLRTLGVTIGVLLALSIVVGLFVRIACVKFVEVHEYPYKVNHWTGGVDTLVQKNGYIFHKPFIESIYTIENRPFNIVIRNSRIANQKLVQFSPKGFRQFIEYHGTGDYYMNNSVNVTNQVNDDKNLYSIFAAYAFEEDYRDGKYSFMRIIPKNSSPVRSAVDTASLN